MAHHNLLRTKCLIAALLLVSACSRIIGAQEDLFESGEYRLRVDKIEGCTLEARAVKLDGRLLVSGRMTFRHHENAPLSGNVFGEIVGPQGNRIETKAAPFEALPHARHLHPAAKFELLFDSAPPSHSVVTIFHTLRPFDGHTSKPGIR